MAGMLFVVSVPNTATERRLRDELHLAAKDRIDGKEPVTLEKGLEDMLQKLRVEHSLWNPVKGGTFFQVIFPTASGDQCENCLHCLSQLGVGKKFSSTVSVAPCNVYLKGVAGDPEVRTEDEDESEAAKRWANFVESIRSKLTVKQVVDGVRSGSECSFDYIALVLTADMIAAVGLVENNSINITAAMLVSPLMSPLMGVTFGVLIANWKLVRIGARTEAVGMLISLLFGFVFGLLVGAACNDMPWGGGVGDFPTGEMKGRGNFRSLWIGILWALPSGTGVALALLQGSAGPLIGVAISASLLPPIVNCGIMWGLACIYCAHEGMKFPYISGEDYSADNFTSEKYEAIYYDDWMPKELACMGIVSFCLTLINFICIFITAVIVLKIKEVAAPYVSPPELLRFWEHDIQRERQHNRSTLRLRSSRRSRRGPGQGPSPAHASGRPSRADAELLSDIRSIPEEELGGTLQAAVREAMGDRTFRSVQRCSYHSSSADVVQALSQMGGAEAAGEAGEAGAEAGDPRALEQLLRSLLGPALEAEEEPKAGAARRPLSRSLRQASLRAHAAAGRRSAALPPILESGKRASLTERALAASRHTLHALRHSRRHSRPPPPPPPHARANGSSAAPPTPAARFTRRSSETVSLTRAEEGDQQP